jgi:prephenate dehydrogenase
MGGSLAGALRGQCDAVVGVARRAETIDTALERGLIDGGTTELRSVTQGFDVVIFAVPVRAIVRMLHEFGPAFQPGCLVMDLGSTKTHIVAAMETLPRGVQPIGGHPMCGKETAGIESADPSIYSGCAFVLTPLLRTSDEARTLSLELVQSIGGYPLVLAPDRHDRLVATVSHLPYLIACALVATGQDAAASDPAVWEIAASGFSDMTRLSASDVTMMSDILLTNRDEVLRAFNVFEGQFRNLAQLLTSSDETGLQAALSSVRDCRVELS